MPFGGSSMWEELARKLQERMRFPEEVKNRLRTPRVDYSFLTPEVQEQQRRLYLEPIMRGADVARRQGYFASREAGAPLADIFAGVTAEELRQLAGQGARLGLENLQTGLGLNQFGTEGLLRLLMQEIGGAQQIQAAKAGKPKFSFGVPGIGGISF